MLLQSINHVSKIYCNIVYTIVYYNTVTNHVLLKYNRKIKNRDST